MNLMITFLLFSSPLIQCCWLLCLFN